MHCTEGSLAWRHQPILEVIIGVLIGAKPVRRGNVDQSLEVFEVEVKPVAKRGS